MERRKRERVGAPVKFRRKRGKKDASIPRGDSNKEKKGIFLEGIGFVAKHKGGEERGQIVKRGTISTIEGGPDPLSKKVSFRERGRAGGGQHQPKKIPF